MTPEQHADAILRAAGLVFSINHAGYVLDFPKPASDLPSVAPVSIRDAILAAVQAVRDDECARVVAWLLSEAQELARDENEHAAETLTEGAVAIEAHEHRSASHDAD